MKQLLRKIFAFLKILVHISFLKLFQDMGVTRVFVCLRLRSVTFMPCKCT